MGKILAATIEGNIHINDQDELQGLNLRLPVELNPGDAYDIAFDVRNDRATHERFLYIVLANGTITKDSDFQDIEPDEVVTVNVQGLPAFQRRDRNTNALITVNIYREVPDEPPTTPPTEETPSPSG